MIKIIENLAKHVGVYAENLNSGKNYYYNCLDIFPAASVIKLPILYELFQEYIKGKYNPETTIFYKKSDYVEDSPWFETREEGFYTLKDIAHSMITVSDNVSTNLLIDLLGIKNINNSIENIGMAHTALNRKMCDFAARERGIENLTTPEDMAIFFKRIFSDYGKPFTSELFKNFHIPEIYNKQTCALEIIKILTEQKDLEKIPSGISGPGILVANKPGELPEIRNDAALIVSGNKNYIISVFSEKVYDESVADTLIAELSAELFRFLNE
jgi:beta-lactamase class A